MITILDCYTDEPSGLGVPPYLGTYPRYLAGKYKDATYITIDDLRLYVYYGGTPKDLPKTNIKVLNRTVNDIKEVIHRTTLLVVVAGVHTPGKYLSAIPGDLNEIVRLIDVFECRKILTGPAAFGTASEGGRFFEKADLGVFDSVERMGLSFSDIKELSIDGAKIVKQIPDLRIIEIETGRGCSRTKGCSFCLEPVKNKFSNRPIQDVLAEIKELYSLGCRHFRIGKQSCFYSYPDAIELLKEIRSIYPDIKMLHIDNVNPVNVINDAGNKITKAIVQYCTPGNVASFGIESFDPVVIKANNLNSDPATSYEAIKIINKFGAEIGENGLPKYLPGINLIFGLAEESKKTREENIKWLLKILDENLLLRRINVRQVDIFEGTSLFNTVGNKFIKKNKKYYWKWRDEIRQKIDCPMLQKVFPVGTVLRDVMTEVHDGNTTFCRQFCTYPIAIGVKGRLELKKFIKVKVTDHMLRSITGEVIK